jgi:hypothetical protein
MRSVVVLAHQYSNDADISILLERESAPFCFLIIVWIKPLLRGNERARLASAILRVCAQE